MGLVYVLSITTGAQAGLCGSLRFLFAYVIGTKVSRACSLISPLGMAYVSKLMCQQAFLVKRI